MVAQGDCLVDVVGDQDDRLVDPLLEIEQLALEPSPHDRVDGTEGLVHEQDGRIGGQGTSHPHPLLLAARHLGRVAIEHRLIETHQLCQLGDRARVRAFSQPSCFGTAPMFWAMVRCGNRPTCWMTYPMFRRSSITDWSRTSTSPIVMVPAVGSMSRLIIRNVVVLPQPDGPMSTLISPAPRVRSSGATAGPVPPGKVLVAPRKLDRRCGHRRGTTMSAMPLAPGPVASPCPPHRRGIQHPKLHRVARPEARRWVLMRFTLGASAPIHADLDAESRPPPSEGSASAEVPPSPGRVPRGIGRSPRPHPPRRPRVRSRGDRRGTDPVSRSGRRRSRRGPATGT